MIDFHQALANITLAYDWEWIDQLMVEDNAGKPAPRTITIKLVEPARIAQAREQLLAGLAAADESRLAFLAETDDDREWVPNPKQNSYAAPLAVDAKLYKTWEAIVGDVRVLVAGKTGLSFKAMAAVLGIEDEAPAGFVDIGAMLRKPKDIVFEIGAIDRIEIEHNAGRRRQLTVTLLKQLLGNGYKKSMKPSPLTDRLIQLRKDVDGVNGAFEDKLKYLLWLN